MINEKYQCCNCGKEVSGKTMIESVGLKDHIKEDGKIYCIICGIEKNGGIQSICRVCRKTFPIINHHGKSEICHDCQSKIKILKNSLEFQNFIASIKSLFEIEKDLDINKLIRELREDIMW